MTQKRALTAGLLTLIFLCLLLVSTFAYAQAILLDADGRSLLLGEGKLVLADDPALPVWVLDEAGQTTVVLQSAEGTVTLPIAGTELTLSSAAQALADRDGAPPEGGATQPGASVVIDINGGMFIFGESSLQLDGTAEKPISITENGGTVLFHIQTSYGFTAILDLNGATVSLTERALNRINLALTGDEAEEVKTEDPEITDDAQEDSPITIEDEETKAEPTQSAASGTCSICGNPLSSGNHEKLACGHYACVVGSNHPTICSYCRRYTCNSLDHNSVCAVCGKHVCTREHRENCSVATAPKGSSSTTPSSSTTDFSPGTGGSYTPSTSGKGNSYYGSTTGEQAIRRRIETVLNAIEKLRAKSSLTASEQADLEAYELELKELYAKLNSL